MKQLLIILVLISTNLFAATNKKITLQLSWKHQFQFAGYYVAKELGYYKSAGIDLNIKEFEYGMDLSEVIKNKKADFAIGRASLLIDKANGADITALGAIFQNSPMILLVRDDSGIDSIKDLKNKRVMTTLDAKSTASLVAMLNSQNIDIDDLQIQKHSFNLDDLISGKTDAMASYISNEPIRLADKNIGYKIFDPKDYGFDFYSDILYTSSKFIKNNPDLTKAFYKATKKGWDYAFNNIGKTAQIIFNKYNSQNKSLVHLVAEGESLKKLAFHDQDGKIGCLDEDKLQRIVDTYKVLGLLKKDIDLDKFIYEHNGHKMVKFNLTHDEIFLLGIIIIAIFLLLIILAFYLSVKKRWLLTKEELEKQISSKTFELKEQTYIDPLTSAKNRKAYIEKAEELLSLNKRYDTPFSMVILDIDNFKKINDSFGHRVGDNVLIDISNLIRSNIRENDFLFRVGGEEFVIIYTQTSLQSAKIVTEKIRKTIEENLNTIKDKTITVSIGLGEVQSEDDEDTIYKRIDNLLYRSKNSGKNAITY